MSKVSARTFRRQVGKALPETIESGRCDDSFIDLLRTLDNLQQVDDQWDLFIRTLCIEARAKTSHRTRLGKRASLWGLTPIVNIIPCAEADRLAGQDAMTVVATTYRISDNFDLILAPQIEYVEEREPSLRIAYYWLVFVWAMYRFDNFFLFNDRGILLPVGGYGSDNYGINLTELQLLSRAGKSIYPMAYGADHRSRERTLALGKYNFCSQCPEIGKFCICDDDEAEKVLSSIAEFATQPLSTGISTLLIPGARNIDYLVIDTTEIPKQGQESRDTKTLKILHSPNHPHFKGTEYLEAAVARLCNEGYDVELVVTSNLTNSEVLRRMRECDVVADQFIAGMFGYTAIEAMALGKPVMCYLAHPEVVPDYESCPIINASPDNLYEKLKEVIANQGELPDIGKRSQEYVEAHYSINSFSDRLVNLYSDTVLGYFAWNAKRHERRLANRVASCEVSDSGPHKGTKSIDIAGNRQALSKFSTLREGVDVVVLNCRAFLYNFRSSCVTKMNVSWDIVRVAIKKRAEVIPLEIAAFLGRITTFIRLTFFRPRTLWGVTPILTLSLLRECDESLQLKSDSVVFTTYSVTSDFDVNLSKWVERLCGNSPRRHRVFAYFVLLYSLLRYDVYHYFFDRGISVPHGRMGINEDELKLLKASGKRVFVYTYGADVRTQDVTRSLGKFNFCVDCPEPGKYCICDDFLGTKNVSAVTQHVNAVLSMGDMGAYIPSHTELHYWPIDLNRIQYIGSSNHKNRRLRIAHATNQPYFKGTSYLLAILEKLREEGHDIELVQISGLPNEEVLRLFADVDIIAEQFIGGFHGYTALEAMAVGKPVLSYIRDLDRLADKDSCPIINTNPDTLYATLCDILHEKYDFQAIGRAGRDYVENYYSVEAVSRRLGQLYLERANFPNRVNRNISRLINDTRAPG